MLSPGKVALCDSWFSRIVRCGTSSLLLSSEKWLPVTLAKFQPRLEAEKESKIVGGNGCGGWFIGMAPERP